MKVQNTHDSICFDAGAKYVVQDKSQFYMILPETLSDAQFQAENMDEFDIPKEKLESLGRCYQVGAKLTLLS